MEPSIVTSNHVPVEEKVIYPSTPFIEANTVEMSLQEIQDKHIIPVFAKNNEPVISQVDFINLVGEHTEQFFGQTLLPAEIRVSHPIKGRIPSARHKPAAELLSHEKTLFYERCAFLYRIPGITRRIEDKELQLTVGGIKAHNQDNLNRYGGSPQAFKIFIGFQVKVCCNLCIFSDGRKEQLKVSSLDQLSNHLYHLLESFDGDRQLKQLHALTGDGLTDSQFATLVGRCRMYLQVDNEAKKATEAMLLSDSQVNSVVRGYYHDDHFRGNGNDISFWSLYNLMTAATKGSYIGTFLSRNTNAVEFVSHLQREPGSWFLR
ncbi:MAG: DUF3871 family protein [Saprospiraceae bacterium]